MRSKTPHDDAGHAVPRRSTIVLAAILATLLVLALALAAPSRAEAAAGPGVVEETSSALTYSGSWKSLTSASSSGGAIRYAAHSASVSLSFTGNTITWYTWRSATAGISNVYIDGKFVAAVDTYASSTQYRVVGYSGTSLGSGTHTIKIVTSGSKNAKSSDRLLHMDSFVVGSYTDTATLPPVPTTSHRYAACPAATVTVSTTDQLRTALSGAKAGTVIRLQPGTYTYPGGFALSVAGTSAKPVWVCGPRTAILTSTSMTDGPALRLQGSSYVRLAGFTVANSLQGVMVKGSTQISVVDLLARDIGYEGIHLYAFTTDSKVMYNTIQRTGRVDVAYGEGVYIGTSQRRWAEVTAGRADASDRNTVAFNDITDAGSEPIEAKEGTSSGQIHGNTIRGYRPGSRALAWVLVTGSKWLVRANVGRDAVTTGYVGASWNEWGKSNVFIANKGAVNAPGYGVHVTAPATYNVIVTCDNTPTGAGSGVTNVVCKP